MTSLKLFDRLSEDVGKLVEKGENYDMIIQVGEKDVKEFKAHSLIISARSLYFKSALNNNWTTIKDGRFFFKKPNISPKIFQLILKYLYTGVVDFQGQELNQIFELMIAADELLLEELTDQIQEYLIKHKPLQIQRNIVLVLHTVFGHDVVVFQKLQDYSLKIISSDPEIIFESDDFVTLKKHILMELLERDDLEIEEIRIWEYLIEWGIAHTPPCLSNVELSNWTTTEFDAIENTLHDCLQLIRYFQMSSDDIYRKVFPYKKILSKQLKRDIVAYFMLSDYRPKSLLLPPRYSPNTGLESLLITIECCSLLENWIKNAKKQNIAKRLSFNWKLLYRASRDGFDARSFHKKCDNQGACVVVAKVGGSNNERIVGGYNPIGWTEHVGQYIAASEAFLFYIENKDLANAKLSRILPHRSSKAVFYDTSCGPNFGAPDLRISNNCNKNTLSFFSTTNFYENSVSIGNFSVIDYEVFQFIKKER